MTSVYRGNRTSYFLGIEKWCSFMDASGTGIRRAAEEKCQLRMLTFGLQKSAGVARVTTKT
jgi:hypothetical protein